MIAKIRSLPTKRLMDLYQLILNYSKERGEHNRSLFLTLLEKVATTIKMRGYRITVDSSRIATFVLTADALCNPENYDREPSNHWREAANLMHETMTTYNSVYMKVMALIEKERIKQNNVNPNMKNILIRIENPALVNYVYGEVRKGITVSNKSIKINLLDTFKHCAIKLTKGTMEVLASGTYIPQQSEEKLFTITAARNADTIIEQVIKEYNKVECKKFYIDGSFGGRSFEVIVYPTHVEFAGHKLTFNDIYALYNAANTQVGLWKVGGIDTILLTHASHNEKIYVSRQELASIEATVRNYQLYNG